MIRKNAKRELKGRRVKERIGINQISKRIYIDKKINIEKSVKIKGVT